MYQNVPDMIREYTSKHRTYRLSVGGIIFCLLVILPLLRVISVGRSGLNLICFFYPLVAFGLLVLLLLLLASRAWGSRYGFWMRREDMEAERLSMYQLVLSILGFIVGLGLTLIYWTLERPSGMEFSVVWDILSDYFWVAGIYLFFAFFGYFGDKAVEVQLKGTRVMMRYIRDTGIEIEDTVEWALNSLKLSFVKTESKGMMYALTGKKQVKYLVDNDRFTVRIVKLNIGGRGISTNTPPKSDKVMTMKLERILENAMRGWQV